MSDFYLNHSFEICVRIRFQSSSEWVEGSLKLSLCRFMCNIRFLSWIDLTDGSFAHQWGSECWDHEINFQVLRVWSPNYIQMDFLDTAWISRHYVRKSKHTFHFHYKMELILEKIWILKIKKNNRLLFKIC